MDKRRFFHLLPMILMLIFIVAGWFATDYLGNKARQEIIGENRASVLNLSIYVSSTFTSVEGAVKSLAGSPWIAPVLLSKGEYDIEHANSTLDRYNSAMNASVSYLMDAGGMTLASSNRNDPDSFVGKFYGFRPYFQEAVNGQVGHYFAIGITSGKRGFYASSPVQNLSGEVIGVVTMKKDIDEIEHFFSKYPFCFLVSPDGIVFLSSQPAMVTKSLWPLDEAVRKTLVASRQFGDNLSEAVMKAEIADGTEVTLEKHDYFVSRKVIDRDGWSIVLLTPADRIRLYRLVGILATISISCLIMIFSGILYITDQSKEAFRQSEENKRLLLHAVGSGIFGVDTRGRVTFVNPAALRLLGFVEEEMLWQNVHGLIHHSRKDGSCYPIEDCPMSASYTHAVDSHVTDEVLWRKDGSSFPVEYSSMSMTKDGKVMGAVVSFTDISDRKRAEEALQESEEKFRLTFSFSPDAININRLDDGLYVDCNEGFTRSTGYTREELIGRTSLEADIWHNPADRQQLVQGLEEKGYYENLEAQFRRKDGNLITALMSARVISLKGVLHIISITRDITDRKLAEEEKARLEVQLRQAQKMESIGSLAGGIAHDLNNILFPISGLSEMLLDEMTPDNPEYENIEQIHKSAQRGSALVKQILAFSRQSKPQKLPIRIQPILKEAVKLVRAIIPVHIEITSHINSDCGMVSADPAQVHQIAINLITNAYHAVEGKGGTINIELKEAARVPFGGRDDLHDFSMPEDPLTGKYACITISDTGTGIDQNLMDRIFDPYFTTKEQGKGTGLGLSVVHGIVKEHGGDIRVYSEVGKGTTFNVYLPLMEETRNGKDPAAAITYPTGCESILLVDDEEPIIRLEQMILEKLGYKVTTRTSSPDALDAFRASPAKFDLVISDRGMPNMSGDQLARELISIRPEIPIILCTGFSDENDRQRAKAIGVKGFLMKPVAAGDLATMVRRVLG